jgi:cyclopropane-fatty-acyl-phospholipid synthase
MFDAVRRHTDFQMVQHADFADHYAHTLALWRQNFWSRIADIRRLGFDERFVRMWDYYLCYCQAGFLERQIGLSQALFAKEEWRPQSLISG